MTNNDEQFNNVTETAQEESAEFSPVTQQNVESVNEQGAAVLEQNGKKKRTKTEIIINVALWVAIAVLIIAVVLRMFVYNTISVQGPSMNPTYQTNDVVTVNKTRTPKRGDVVVFYKYPVDSKFKAMFAGENKRGQGEPYELLIKRVVATEGDKIYAEAVEENTFHQSYRIVIETVQGDVIYEDYYQKKGETLPLETFLITGGHGEVGLGNLSECTKENPFVVSKNCFYAMGDNRSVSDDSRGELGEVPLSRLFGVVIK